MNYRVGVDVSGGDFVPTEIVQGAVLAQEESKERIVLIGVREEIEKEAHRQQIDLSLFDIVEAPQKISMGESAATSIRRKRNSSIVVGVNLLKEKKIDAFVSCGNTGAVVCAATLKAGLIEGVERAGIAIAMPTVKGISLIIDVGANIDPKPLHLLQYGVMASVYCTSLLNKDHPTVGLLNIGEEETKGGDFVRQAHRLFSSSSLNFIGNVEAKDIFSGKCDAIVCDGFAGNIALKVSEGLSKAVSTFILDSVKKDFLGKLGLLLIKRSFKNFKRITDYAEYGGAPLLGVDGIVIIGHGRSHAIAVKNAIKVAVKELRRDLNTKIKGRINEICQDSRLREILTQ